MNDGGEYVLVVDDDADLREALVELLEDRVCNVRAASNGREALNAIRRDPGRPCVILLDVMMPIMDGKTFHDELMKTPAMRDIPVIILSAHAKIDELFSDQEVVAKLKKPIEVEPLLKLVDTHCKNHGCSEARNDRSS